VIGKKSGIEKLHGEIEAGLTAERSEKTVDFLFYDDAFDDVDLKRFNVNFIRHSRVGHNGRRVAVDEDDIESFLLQGTACLGACVVKLCGLTDDDRSGADDQDPFYVCSSGHEFLRYYCEAKTREVATANRQPNFLRIAAFKSSRIRIASSRVAVAKSSSDKSFLFLYAHIKLLEAFTTAPSP